MASGDNFDLLQGYTGITNVFRIQVQKASGVYQARIGARNDACTWTDSTWQNLASGWNALEIECQAAHNAGSLSLWIGGTLKATLSAIDNDGSKIDSIRLGAQGVDTGTRGTIYFDDPSTGSGQASNRAASPRSDYCPTPESRTQPQPPSLAGTT